MKGSLSDRDPGRPAPVEDLRHVLAMLANIKLVTLHNGPVALVRVGALTAEALDPMDRIKRELIAIDFVQDDHVEGRCRCSFIAKSAHMDIVVIAPLIG